MDCSAMRCYSSSSNNMGRPSAFVFCGCILVTTLSLAPAAADKLAEILGDKAARLMRAKKKKTGEGSLRASDQLTEDDFITPYIDDEDTDEEE